VFLYGPEMEETAAVLEKSGGELPWHWTCDREELSLALARAARPGDLVLLKGSRGCALETLGDLLGEGAGKSSSPLMAGGGY
jgi:UDP-N-acetylmuramyl pentapeptide synthase